jgi:hypothetical protein
MRSLSEKELQAIAMLAQLPIADREIQQQQQKVIIALGKPLPIIHQVLFT